MIEIARIRCGDEKDRKVPENVQRVAREYGGLNPYGEPNYRVVWGWQRHQLLEGVWTKAVQKRVLVNGEPRDVPDTVTTHIGARIVPKYPGLLDRYILERWIPPSQYGSPEAWEANNRTWDPHHGVLMSEGPYPRRGDYEMIWHFRHPKTGDFEHVTENMVINRIRWSQQRMDRTPGEVRKDVLLHREREAREADQRMNDIHEANVAAFPMKSWVPVSGTLPSLPPGIHR